MPNDGQITAGEDLRLDTLLVRRGFAAGRERAKELLAAGTVTVNGRPVSKASARVRPTDEVVCRAPAPRYVGRGGYKLEKVLHGRRLDGTVCIDVGASTGGFTDCMRQNGAAHVYAVDVGRNQLHRSLRDDPAVTPLEGTDIRSPQLSSVLPAHGAGLIVIDVSFISLTYVLPAVLPYLRPDGTVVCLIKPQFEAGRAAIGKRGVVRDPRVHRRVLDTLLAFFPSCGLTVGELTYSPITGGEGNIEYLAVLHPDDAPSAAPPVPFPTDKLVAEAFSALRRTDEERGSPDV